jgi:hypothetical protein
MSLGKRVIGAVVDYEHDANKLPYGTQCWWDRVCAAAGPQPRRRKELRSATTQLASRTRGPVDSRSAAVNERSVLVSFLGIFAPTLGLSKSDASKRRVKAPGGIKLADVLTRFASKGPSGQNLIGSQRAFSTAVPMTAARDYGSRPKIWAFLPHSVAMLSLDLDTT